jgi:uncharacterized membrane protein YebE (DUF533 family)
MADEDVQITTPLLGHILAPARSPRTVGRIKALAPVSRLARALHDQEVAETPASAAAPSVSAPPAETHARLTAATAATVSLLHAVEGALMVRAMIEAAKADGAIDTEERRRILTGLVDAGASDADRRALIAALDQPPDMEGLVAQVTGPELAVEVYAASLLAIRDDKPSEQRYLARLATRLGLSADAVAAMHARFGDPPPLAPEA